MRPAARGDVTLAGGSTNSDAVAWSKPGRGSYMPTPLAYNGILYVLANNGVFDAHDVQTGEEIYRQRLKRPERLQRVTRRGRRLHLPHERGWRKFSSSAPGASSATSRPTRWESC